ncbi:MAG: hypothetical protein KAI16_01335 [Candidatus Pacebacteria bacterium]|nr:hypothetical protein [Candidatus Paceibacterota bacterium]
MSLNSNGMWNRKKNQETLKRADRIRDFLKIQEKTTGIRVGARTTGEMEGIISKIIEYKLGEMKEMKEMINGKFNPELIFLFKKAWFNVLKKKYSKIN